jgi:antirestriction protein
MTDNETEYAQAVTDSFVPGDALAAIVDLWSMPETAETVADLEDRYLGEDTTETAWAEEWLLSSGLLSGLEEDLRRYFDFAGWMRDARLSGDITVVDTAQGVAVFHN